MSEAGTDKEVIGRAGREVKEGRKTTQWPKGQSGPKPQKEDTENDDPRKGANFMTPENAGPGISSDLKKEYTPGNSKQHPLRKRSPLLGGENAQPSIQEKPESLLCSIKRKEQSKVHKRSRLGQLSLIKAVRGPGTGKEGGGPPAWLGQHRPGRSARRTGGGGQGRKREF